MLEKFFKLKENGTNVRTEVIAGITTFMTMAYILAVNPNILSATGMNKEGVFVATALAAIIGTVAMALLANYPYALAPGMGLNAFFTFTVVLGFGYSWQTALFAIFVEGIIFLILTAFNIREALFNAIPKSLKHAISAGIGLFIAFIGLQNAGIVVNDDATLVGLGDMTSATVVLAIVGVILTAILIKKKVTGAILIGIMATFVLGMIAQVTGWYVVDINAEVYSVIPEAIVKIPEGLNEVVLFGWFGEGFTLNLNEILSLEFFVVVFAFLFVDMFDTLGTLIGVATKTNQLDEEGKLPKAKQALFADSIATTAGALLGTSTTTTYVESAAGAAVGGRTGLTGIVVAIMFGIALLFSPIFLAIPGFATAPALIIVGFFMIDGIKEVDFEDASEAIPAFLTLIIMPLTYSISEGIIFGVISYVIINLFVGKKEKKVNLVMIILAVVFIFYYLTPLLQKL